MDEPALEALRPDPRHVRGIGPGARQPRGTHRQTLRALWVACEAAIGVRAKIDRVRTRSNADDRDQILGKSGAATTGSETSAHLQ